MDPSRKVFLCILLQFLLVFSDDLLQNILEVIHWNRKPSSRNAKKMSDSLSKIRCYFRNEPKPRCLHVAEVVPCICGQLMSQMYAHAILYLFLKRSRSWKSLRTQAHPPVALLHSFTSRKSKLSIESFLSFLRAITFRILWLSCVSLSQRDEAYHHLRSTWCLPRKLSYSTMQPFS